MRTRLKIVHSSHSAFMCFVFISEQQLLPYTT